MRSDHELDYSAEKSLWVPAGAHLALRLRARREAEKASGAVPPGPAIAISRQVGIEGNDIAALAAGLLQAREPWGSVPWTVFDRHLLDQVLQEHNLPGFLAEFITRDHRSVIRSLMDEWLGMIPPPWEIVPKIAETVLHLAAAGHAILVGRGAVFITARLPYVFRVRLIGSLPRRIERVQAAQGAAAAVEQEDRARARFVKTNFNLDINDSQLYHLVINTDDLPGEDAAQVIADAAWRFFRGVASSRRLALKAG